MNDVPAWLQITATIASIVAAVAAAFSAWQSRKAADANRVIAEQTRATVGRVFRPDLVVRQAKRNETDRDHERGLAVINSSQHAAYNVRLVAVLSTGETIREVRESLAGGERITTSFKPVGEWPTWSDESVHVLSSARLDYENRFGVRYHRQFEPGSEDGYPEVVVDLMT